MGADRPHETLVQDAVEAIDNIFSDRSVSPEETRQSLIELRDEIDNHLACLSADSQ